MVQHNKHLEELDINLKEDAVVKVSLKGVWAFFIAIVVGTTMVVGYQLKTDYKMDKLFLENQHGHDQIMTKLAEIQMRSEDYAWKNNVENAFVFVNKLRDEIDRKAGHTNGLVIADELKFREAIRQFLR